MAEQKNENETFYDEVEEIIEESAKEEEEVDENGQKPKKRRAARKVIVETARNWNKQDINRGIIFALALIVVVIVSMLLTKISVLGNFLAKVFSALTPVFLGLGFAYVINPLHNLLTRLLFKPFSKKCKKPEKAQSIANAVGLTLTILILLTVIIGILAILIPQLKDSLVKFYNNLPTYFNNIREYLKDLFSGSPSAQKTIDSYLSNFESTMSNFFKDTLLPNMDTIVAKISSGIMDGVSVIADILVGLVVAIYVLAQKKKLASQSKKLLFSVINKKHGTQVLEATHYVNSVFEGFVNGKILDSLMIGIFCMLFCSIVNVPYGLLVSVIIAVTNLIPFFGPFIGAIPSALIILVESPKLALVFIIFIFVLQQLDANFVQPIVLGDATGLSGTWVLFAIIVGSGMFGVVGMLLAVPVFAIIYTLFVVHMQRRLKNREMAPTTEYYDDLIGFDDEGNPIRGEREKKKTAMNRLAEKREKWREWDEQRKKKRQEKLENQNNASSDNKKNGGNK